MRSLSFVIASFGFPNKHRILYFLLYHSKTNSFDPPQKLAILHSVENPQAIAQLQSIKPSTQIFFWTYDVTMAREDMKQYFDEVMVQMDYIDVLINGATLCDESDIDATINTNLTGMMNTCATVLPYMDKQQLGKGGLIVNVTSVVGLDPSPVFCAYSASKFGVIGFTRSLAVGGRSSIHNKQL